MLVLLIKPKQAMQNKIDCSIVIPLYIYNEEKNLPELQERLSKALKQLKESWKIIYVDDGSCDSSPSLLKDFHQNDSKEPPSKLGGILGIFL